MHVLPFMSYINPDTHAERIASLKMIKKNRVNSTLSLPFKMHRNILPFRLRNRPNPLRRAGSMMIPKYNNPRYNSQTALYLLPVGYPALQFYYYKPFCPPPPHWCLSLFKQFLRLVACSIYNLYPGRDLHSVNNFEIYHKSSHCKIR